MSNAPETKDSLELIDLWAAALLSRDAVGVEDIVRMARRTHPSSGLIGA